ncbi:MAG: succinate dehydrogenase cytochrome b subunit [Chthoniobacterales bacterium]|jgi:succinate dehydrogenase / fumarate reductase cytochrome b subunit
MSVAPVATGIRQPNPLLVFARSSIGKKWIVGISGVLLILFVLAHLAGNLTIYIGPYGEGINLYAQALHASQIFLWSARGGLVVVFLVHVFTTLSLVLENRRARPQGYAVKAHVQSTIFARSMALSGLVVLSFIIFHVLQFAAGLSSHSGLYDLEGRHDVAAMIILSFHNPLVSGFYLLSLVLLGMHLSHGLASVFQTFGLNGRKSAGLIKCGAIVVAWGLMAGFASIPLAAVAGYLKVLPAEQRVDPAKTSH